MSVRRTIIGISSVIILSIIVIFVSASGNYQLGNISELDLLVSKVARIRYGWLSTDTLSEICTSDLLEAMNESPYMYDGVFRDSGLYIIDASYKSNLHEKDDGSLTAYVKVSPIFVPGSDYWMILNAEKQPDGRYLLSGIGLDP